MADFYVPLTKKSTFIKISFPCTFPTYAKQKTKDKPKKNQGTSKELPNKKSAFY